METFGVFIFIFILICGMPRYVFIGQFQVPIAFYKNNPVNESVFDKYNPVNEQLNVNVTL